MSRILIIRRRLAINPTLPPPGGFVKVERGPIGAGSGPSGIDMDEHSTGDEAPDSPEAILDAIREGGEADREARLARLVERFPADRLVEAARGRLGDLGGPDGEAVLRLVEAYATPGLLDELARALGDQPDLPPERAWEALALLDGSGVLDDHPELASRWEELNEAIEEGDPLGTLVGQLEEEPEGSWVALQGLGAVEPEVRSEIIGGLAASPGGPGLVAFLRILAFAGDPPTREAALAALDARDDADRRTAWAELAHDHPDLEVRERARRRLGADPDLAIADALAREGRARPQAVGDLVTALDGQGRGSIVLASSDRGRWVVASFACDIWHGVVEVVGHVGDDPGAASALFAELAARPGRDAVEDAPGLAPGLLAGCLLLGGPATNPATRYWIERAVGPEFRPRPFAGLLVDDLDELAPGGMAEASRLVLGACPDWVDASPLTFELAEEVALRSGESPSDPRRDAGAYRYLFEHRLVGRLEHYRRMLLWMASFWHASGDPDLARSALGLARELSDPQHAVPAHPFAVELTTRSLAAARADLRAGLDPRAR